MKRYRMLLDTLDRLERGVYSGLDIHWCCDTIHWLAKFKKIPKSEIDVLCDRAIAIMENQV